MTKREKEDFCALAAAMLAPPSAEMLEDLHTEGVRAWLEQRELEWTGDKTFASPLFGEGAGAALLPELEAAYGRLFVDYDGARVSLVESAHKPWTGERGCGLLFAPSKGLLMGDSALHIRALYEESSVQVPEEFRSMPDHLVLELEFLALLYRCAPDGQVAQFIADHLDWIPELSEDVRRAGGHPFYTCAVRLVDLFVKEQVKEKVRGPWTEEASCSLA